MDRRSFVKLATAALLAGEHARLHGATEPTLFYADGYHGGARGHMPDGCWRDILDALKLWPDWKLSLDVEAGSWAVLQERDPETYHELQAYLADRTVNARVELTGGTFAQPYGWAISGESNIRQLQRGLEVHRNHFPDASIEVYAVQEPCWSSCLPQILLSFGFTGASLKDASTAWGGYSAGCDAELVNWIGPDGSAIITVPRYSCEDLEKVFETAAVEGTPAYMQKCLQHGIAQPMGMCFQDLGWAAKPRVEAPYIRYVTWREYFRTIATVAPKDWHFTTEDILTTLPWGEKTLQRVAQQSRSAESRLLVAEKLASLAAMYGNAPWPGDRLRNAWEEVMWSQFHDSWITATTKTGREAWAFQVAAETLDAENTAESIIAESAQAISQGSGASSTQPLAPQSLRVLNPGAFERDDLVACAVTMNRGAQGVRVQDASGREVPCQWRATREFHTQPASSGPRSSPSGQEGINTAEVLFRPRTPSLGFSTYQVVPTTAHIPPAPAATSALAEANGDVVLQNDLYVLRIDPHRGGILSSLRLKSDDRELCSTEQDQLFNEYRGYFISQAKWRSSTEAPARVEILEAGPLRARVVVHGEVGGCPFRTTITVAEGQRRIDFDVTFRFDGDTWIGDPWDIDPQNRNTEKRRSQNDGRWKLQARFPTSLSGPALYKNSAYDVCRSRVEDTSFQRWDEIRHNIIVNWVDLLDRTGSFGCALFSEHTTAYNFGPDQPLSLVLGWGWEGGFWWGKCPLRGEQRARYSLLPHQGSWEQALLWKELQMLEEPLTAQLVDGPHVNGSGAASLIAVSEPAVLVPAAQMHAGALEVRLFNAQSRPTDCAVSFGFRSPRVQQIELDGRVSKELSAYPGEGGRDVVRVSLPRFGVRTLRFISPSRREVM